jgi:hypothetical protein
MKDLVLVCLSFINIVTSTFSIIISFFILHFFCVDIGVSTPAQLDEAMQTTVENNEGLGTVRNYYYVILYLFTSFYYHFINILIPFFFVNIFLGSCLYLYHLRSYISCNARYSRFLKEGIFFLSIYVEL